MLEEESLFNDRVNEILSNFQAFREICTNVSDHAFNKSYLKVGYLRKEYLFVSLVIKYNIITFSTTTGLYSRDIVLLNMSLEWPLQCHLYHAFRSYPMYGTSPWMYPIPESGKANSSSVISDNEDQHPQWNWFVIKWHIDSSDATIFGYNRS